MAEEIKKASKPEGSLEGVKIAQGLKEAPEEPEVSGHISPFPGYYYACWHCGASNYVPGGWSFFYCWNDGAFNRV